MVKPICCGQEAQWTVQSISLAYWFCKVCKKEPSGSATAVNHMVNDSGTMKPRAGLPGHLALQLPPGWVPANGQPLPQGIYTPVVQGVQSPIALQVSQAAGLLASQILNEISITVTNFAKKHAMSATEIVMGTEVRDAIAPAYGNQPPTSIFGLKVTVEPYLGWSSYLGDRPARVGETVNLPPQPKPSAAYIQKGTHLHWNVAKDQCRDCGCTGAQYQLNSWSCSGYLNYAKQQAAQQLQQITKGIP